MKKLLQQRRRYRPDRRGNVLILTALLMTVMIALLAFAVDLGYMNLARTELQRTADSAAMAATWELIDPEFTSTVDLTSEIYTARNVANTFSQRNKVCASGPNVDLNLANSTSGDVLVGYLSDPFDPSCSMTYNDMNNANAVRVKVRKASTQNGEVPYFFARVLGLTSESTEAHATAALIKNFKGFKAPESGENLAILPFALDVETWNNMLAGGGNDSWRWDPDTKQICSGSDGIREINLYPQGTGSPGNRGTVDIGGANNSTADLARQITEGISETDLSHFENGELKFDDNGELALNGDTGISAGVKDELSLIKGEPRIIPLFSSVVGPGNNAEYTIVQWVGVRVLDVKLTGSMSSKRVIIQPCRVFTEGGIPNPDEPTSQFVYSPVWLVK
jgi:Flp pilus assembly protein TadG